MTNRDTSRPIRFRRARAARASHASVHPPARFAVAAATAVLMALSLPAPANAASVLAPSVAVASSAVSLPTANLSFESGLTGWTTKGTVTVKTDAAHDGAQSVQLAAGASISQTVTGIPQGSYTVSGWFGGSASNNAAALAATDTGAPTANLLLDTYLGGAGTWTQAAHRNVLVYNGQVTVTITAGSSALTVDDLVLTLDAADANPLQNWGFEDGLTGWTVNDAAKVAGVSQGVDTGAGAVQLAAGGELSQTIAVEPDTHYIVTARARVETPDTYTSQTQTDQFGTIGTLVTRTTTGDRVNIGVRGADGAVLRQAPAGSDGWSLVTASFTTGPDDHEVTVYANTIADQAYRDSVGVYTGTDAAAAPADDWAGNGAHSAWIDNVDLFSIDDSYVRGADVSNLQVLEDNGGKYFQNGVQQDALRILSNRGVTSITSMIFVHGGENLYDSSLNLVKIGDAIPGGGTYPDTPKRAWDGYNDEVHTVALASRAAALDLSFLPSYHLSDSFMSASKAFTPYEWLNRAYDGTLSNSDLAHLKSAVYNHVLDSLDAIAATGVEIAGVKQGNEQNGGVVWPVGQGATSVGHAALITAVHDALEAVVPGVSGFAHTDNGYSTTSAQSFFKGLMANGAEIDGAAFSLYGGRSSANILNMANMINGDAALRYLDYVNVETALSFTSYKATWATDNIINPPSQYYSRSVTGQYNWLLDYMQAPLDVPNPYGQTRGFYFWEIDWIPVSGIGSKQGVPADVSTRTMFNNGNPTVVPAGSTQPGKAGDALDSLDAYLMRGTVKDKPAAMETPLDDLGAYAVAATAPTGITLADTSIELTAGARQRLQPVVAPTDQVLTDADVVYTSADPSVATVSAYGYVVGVAPGSTTVTATDAEGHAATATVTVDAATTASSGGLAVSAGGTPLTDGQTLPVTALARLQLTSTLDASVSNRMLTYTSSDPAVASFLGETWQTPAGALEAYSGSGNTVQLDVHDAGTTDLTIATADGGASITVHVTSTKVAVTGVTLEKTSATVSQGATVALGGKAVPSNATLYKLTWSSADEAIATVDSAGVVTGVADGQTTITATSEDNPAATATATITVGGVKATSISLIASDIRLQTGGVRTLQAVVAPADASDEVTWSSSDTAVATVDGAGTVTAVAAGTAEVTATTADGSALTATAHITVTDAADPVTALTLDAEDHWFRSDYFNSDPLGTAPTHAFALTVSPADATNADIVWTSDTPDVATVDATGTVTPVGSGVATITAATRDGSVSASATVYVPTLSESFESRGSSYNWGLTSVPGVAAMTAKVTTGAGGKALVMTAKSGSTSSGLQKVLATPVTSSQIVADFTYNVGTPGSSKGGYFGIADSQGQRYLTLGFAPNGPLAYGSGGVLDATNSSSTLVGSMTSLGSAFSKNAAWYHVHAVIDTEAETVTFTITSFTDASISETRTIPFDPATDFTGDVAKLQFWTASSAAGQWYPAVAEANIWAAAPVAKTVTVDAASVRLLPVSGTLAVSRQLTASVLPATAPDDVTWTSSDTDVVTVSDTGLVTAAHVYDSLEDIVPGEADITVAAASDPSVTAVVHVVVTSTPHASEQLRVLDRDGVDVVDDPITLSSDDVEERIAFPTGGDGPSDVAAVSWTSSDPTVATVTPDAADPVHAFVNGLRRGSAYITLEVLVYGDDKPITARMQVDVDGGGWAPEAPAAPDAEADGHDVTVSWTAPDDGGAPITGYTVRLAPESGPILTKTVEGTATSVTFSDVADGAWTATVAATNVVGTSPTSDPSDTFWVDVTAPVIAGLPGDIVNEADGLELAIAADDPESGILSLAVTFDGAEVPATGHVSLAGLGGERALVVTAVDRAGLTTTVTRTILVVPVDGATAKPGAGTLSNTSGWTTGLRDGTYDVVMNLWWGTPGSVFRLYENDILIATKVLGPVSGTSQKVTVRIADRGNGTYTYRGELINTKGLTPTSQTIVSVSAALPGKPVVSHDNWDKDGSFTVTANMWWGTNATSYTFLLDGEAVGEGTLVAASPNAQKATASLTGVAAGTHVLEAVFTNAFGSTRSDPVTVVVK